MAARRPSVGLALAFMAGAMMPHAWPGEWGRATAGGCLVFLAAAVLCLIRKPEPSPPSTALALADRLPEYALDSPLKAKSDNWFVRRRAGWLLLAFGAAFGFGALRMDGFRGRLADAFAAIPERGVCVARVAGIPENSLAGPTSGFRYATVTAESLDGESARGAASAPMQLRLEGPAEFRRGDALLFEYIKEAPPPAAFPGAFDRTRWLETRGLAGTLRVVRGPPQVLRRDGVAPWTSVMRGLDGLRRRAVGQMLTTFPDQDAGLLAAMLYGYRVDLRGETQQIFRRIGIAHLLSISGLHVGLVVAMVWWTLGWFIPDQRVRAAACIALTMAYLGLSGARVAACRSAIMASVYLGGIVLSRRGDTVNALGLAALALSVFNPTYPLDLGFQLSFLAVLFISRLQKDFAELHRRLAEYLVRRARRRADDALVEAVAAGIDPPDDRHGLPDSPLPSRQAVGRMPPWARRYPSLFRIRMYVGGLVGLSLSAWVGNAPLVAYAFGQMSPAGLVVNLVAVPLTGLVLAGGILLPFAWLLPAAVQDAATLLCLAPTRMLLLLADAADRWPGAMVPTALPAWGWVFGFYVASGVFLLRRGFDGTARRRVGWAGVVATLAMAVGVAASAGPRPPPTGGRVSLLPGRSGGILVAEAPEGAVVAVGPPDGWSVWNVSGYLKHLGRLRLDQYVVLLDANPSRGGGAAPTPRDVRLALREIAGEVRILAVPRVAKKGVELPAGVEPWELFDPPRAVEYALLPGTPSIDFALGRDRGGRMGWWSLRSRPAAGEEPLAATVADRLWPSQIRYRMGRRFPGYDAPAMDWLVRGSPEEAETLVPEGVRVFWRGTAPVDALRRADWGAIQVTATASGGTVVHAYDGRRWVEPGAATRATNPR